VARLVGLVALGALAFLAPGSSAYTGCVFPGEAAPPNAPENWCRKGIYEVDSDSGQRKLLALPGPHAESGRIGLTDLIRTPDGRRILYGPNFAGEGGLYLARLDGGSPQRVSPESVRATFRTWSYSAGVAADEGLDVAISRDGSWIAFTAFDPCSGTACARFELYVVRADGTGLRLVAPSGRNPSWSADGRRIAYETDIHYGVGYSRAIAVVRRDGTGRRRLATGQAPVFAPRGGLIVYRCGVRDRAPLCLTDRTGRSRRTLPGGAARWPLWSPDAGRLAYRTEAPSAIRITSIGGSRGTNVLARAAPGRMGPPLAWSPDGRQLAYARFVTNGSQIYARVVRGGGERRLTNEPPHTAMSDVRWERSGHLTFLASVHGLD
jgi:Tol biopolymer transport system component